MDKKSAIEALDQIKAGNINVLTEEMYVYLKEIIEQEPASHVLSDIGLQRKKIELLIILFRLQKAMCSNPWKKFVIGMYISFLGKRMDDVESDQDIAYIIDELMEMRYFPKTDRNMSRFEEKLIEIILEILNGIVT